MASVQIIEENLFQWVHCKYLQRVIFAYFTHISLQLLLTFNWESDIHRFLSVNICSHTVKKSKETKIAKHPPRFLIYGVKMLDKGVAASKKNSSIMAYFVNTG